MKPGQGLTEVPQPYFQALSVLAEYEPDLLLVHGDTTTTPPRL